MLDATRHHLGTPGFAEWEEFEGKTPHGRRLDLRFEAATNRTEQTLLIRQRDVKAAWTVQLNGRNLGRLAGMDAEQVTPLAVPPGALRDGENTLSILPPTTTDDIVVGEFQLDPRPLKDALSLARVEVRVSDADSGAALPCRITIAEPGGALVPLFSEPHIGLAVRTGVVYTRDGRARIGLRPGEYVLYAGRGFEYGVATQRVTVATGDARQITLKLRREVQTAGWIAADSHIHTLTHSRHGDSSIDERMVTIAGEGIELAIATDHNHHADYTDAAARTQLYDHFSHVIGNEVTTKVGHFNAFPIQPGSAVADFKVEDWTLLLRGIRATPGVQVIQLNHPRDVHGGFIPLGPTNFNDLTGEHVRAEGIGFDAMEVITSAAMQSDIMRLFRDWFALLNRGHRIAAIGSSDTHDVSRFILGQGRTYVACDDADSARLNLDQVWRSYREGRVLVSMGLLTHLKVNGKFGVGDLATGSGRDVEVEVTVLGPRWADADRMELFANGVKMREQTIRPAAGAVEKARVRWRIPRPAHDVHLVAIATGPGVSGPFWQTPRPYQPSSKVHRPRVIGATNPVWLDADGDGKFTPAHAYAAQLVEQAGGDPARLIKALANYDEAVAVQAASVCQSRGLDVRSADFQRALGSGAAQTREGFAAFARQQAVRVR